MSSINGATSALNNPMAFRLASVYGVRAPQPATKPAQTPAPGQIQPTRGSTTDSPAAADPTNIGRLVAAVVPGRIDFTGDEPAQTGSLSLYRHPADRNVAATGVEAGRVIDLQG